MRSAEVTASARTLPALSSEPTGPESISVICTSCVITALIDGALPLYGTFSAFKPVRDFTSSMISWNDAAGYEYAALLASFFVHATSSASDFAGKDSLTQRISGNVPASEIGAKSLIGSYASFAT